MPTEDISLPGLAGTLHRPESEPGLLLVLAHGAGSNKDAPLLRSVAKAFAENGSAACLRINLAYRQQNTSGPPRGAQAAEADRQSLRTAADWLREKFGGQLPLVLGGHSYGGRQASMLAAQDQGVADALLLLSYPLHPPRKPAELRTGHFADLQLPVLFLHGSRDPFGLPEEMRNAIDSIPGRTHLELFEKAGHDLKNADVGLRAIEQMRALLFDS